MATISQPQKGKNVNGTTEADDIVLKYYQLYSDKHNTIPNDNSSSKGLKINSKGGNDYIVGTKYSDTITGGSGTNTIVINNENFGNDVINLTKDENLVFDLKKSGITDFSDIKFSLIGKNLKISILDNGTLTLKNYLKNSLSSLCFDLGIDNKVIFNSASELTSSILFEYDNSNLSKKGVLTTSNYDDSITITGDKKHKINAKNGENILNITGGNNTLTTGKNNDTFNIEGSGIYKIKAGAGLNKINVNTYSDFGKIVINEQYVKATNILNFNYNTPDNFEFKPIYVKSGKDLILKKDDNNTITIKGYFSTKKNKVSYNIDFSKSLLNISGKGKFSGTTNNDNILGSKSNDTITGGKGDDTINGATGKNTYVFNIGDGNDTIISGGGKDKIKFSTKIENITYQNNGKDLIIFYSENDSITLKDYFGSSPHSVQTILNGKKSLNIQNEINDTYICKDNGENTDIYSNGGIDILYFPDNVSLLYEHDFSNDDLVIKYGTSSITLKDYYKLDNYSITKIDKNNIADLIENNVTEIYTFTDNGNNMELYSNGGTDVLNFPTNDLKYERDLTNNDLIIKYGNSSVTLKDYYSEDNNSTTKIGNEIISSVIENSLSTIHVLSDNGKNIDVTNNVILKFPDNISIIYEHDHANNDLAIRYGKSTVTIKDYFITSIDEINIKLRDEQGNDKDIHYCSNENINEIYRFTNTGNNDDIYSNGGTDTLIFPTSYLTYEHNFSNDDLLIKYNSSTVTLKDYFGNSNHSVTQIGKSNIEDLIRNNINELYILEDAGDNTIIYSNGGYDTLKFPTSELYYEHNMENDDLVIKYGNSKATIRNYFKIKHSVDKIITDDYNDSIEYLISRNITEIYNFTNNNSTTFIELNGGIDILNFPINYELTFEHNTENNNLTIKYGDSSVVIKDYYSDNYSSVIKIGNEEIVNLIQDNTNEIYTLKDNGENIDIYSNGGIDMLKFPTKNLNYQHDLDTDDLIIIYGNSSATIKDYFGNNNHSVVKIGQDNISNLIQNNLVKIYSLLDNCENINITNNVILKFPQDTSITYEHDYANNDLVIRYGKSTVTIIDYFITPINEINIKLRDERLIDSYIYYYINDNINEIYRFTDDGSCTEIYSNGGMDNLEFPDDNIKFERDYKNENDLIVKYGNSSVLIKNYFYYLHTSNYSIKTINGLEIQKLILDNNIETYYSLVDDNINRGFYHSPSYNNFNRLLFPNDLDLTFEHDFKNNDLIIKYGNSSVTLYDYYLGNHAITTIGNNSVDDLIFNNTNEIYTFTENSKDTVIKSNGGNDLIKFYLAPFSDLDLTNLKFEHDMRTNNLIITFKDITITVEDYYNILSPIDLEIYTKYESNYISAEDFDFVINGVKIYTLENNGENIEVKLDDTIKSLKFLNNDLTYSYRVNNDDLIIEYGESSVTLKDYLLSPVNYTLKDNTGNSIYLFDDIMINPLNKTLNGANYGLNMGKNALLYKYWCKHSPNFSGYNIDLAVNGSSLGNPNIKTYSCYFGERLYESQSPFKFILKVNEDTKNEDVYKGYFIPFTYNINRDYGEYIINSDSSLWTSCIVGGVSNNILNGKGYKYTIGGKGDDYLYGACGTTFEFAKGDGNDTIYKINNTDSLLFDDVELDEITYHKTNNDLIISYNNEIDSITIRDYFINDLDNLLIKTSDTEEAVLLSECFNVDDLNIETLALCSVEEITQNTISWLNTDTSSTEMLFENSTTEDSINTILSTYNQNVVQNENTSLIL